MAEKRKEPKQLTLGLEEPKAGPPQKATTSSCKVVLKDDTSKAPSIPARRKKPSVTTRSMTVKIPQQNKSEQPAANQLPRTKVRTAEQPNPHLV
ncbi:MAG: hypothetical protein RBU26_09135, partial [Sphaerochaeta sp.]